MYTLYTDKYSKLISAYKKDGKEERTVKGCGNNPIRKKICMKSNNTFVLKEIKFSTKRLFNWNKQISKKEISNPL